MYIYFYVVIAFSRRRNCREPIVRRFLHPSRLAYPPPETPPSREESVGVYYTSIPVDRALGRVRPAERKQFSLCAPKLKA